MMLPYLNNKYLSCVNAILSSPRDILISKVDSYGLIIY